MRAALLLALIVARSAAAAPSESEARLLDLVNAERHLIELEPLSWNEPLAEAARAHCADMRERGALSHFDRDGKALVDRVALAGLRLSRVAENVARAPNLASAHDGIMQSPHHRANVLDPNLRDVGLGVIEADDGTWVVEDFGTLGPAADESAAKASVLKELVARRWTTREDATLSRSAQDIAQRLAAEDTASVSGRAYDGCWLGAIVGADPAALPSRAPACRATRAGIGVAWARTASRPLGAWFVAIILAG